MEIYLVILIIYLLYVKNVFYSPIDNIVNYFDYGNKVNEYQNNYYTLKNNLKENTETGINYIKENISAALISDTFVKDPLSFLKRLQNIILNFSIKDKFKPYLKKIYNFFYIFELDKYYKKSNNKDGILPTLKKLGYPENVSKEVVTNAKNIVYLLSNIYLVYKCYNDLDRFNNFSNSERLNYYKNISCMLFLFNRNFKLAKSYIKYFFNIISNKENVNNNIQDYLNSLKKIVIDKINLVNLFIEKLTVKLIRASNIDADYIESDKIVSNKIDSESIRSDKIVSNKIESDKIESESIRSEEINSIKAVSDEIIVSEININNAYLKNAKVNDIECKKMVVTSDRRMKKNIKKMEINFNDIEKINAYKYQYKDESSSPNNKKNQDFHIGLMAQELENIYPELVVEKNGIKNVNYVSMIPILVENIKDIRKKIN